MILMFYSRVAVLKWVHHQFALTSDTKMGFKITDEYHYSVSSCKRSVSKIRSIINLLNGPIIA